MTSLTWVFPDIRARVYMLFMTMTSHEKSERSIRSGRSSQHSRFCLPRYCSPNTFFSFFFFRFF
ncbi:hypothetical protein BCR43DRAFT_494564 [Syncephalastrum racemosum]|uniref:Uncharacterized protein n=1 Tax=Syncephalastrum racemosum TaxID=13706 RepID=A0A1X2H865_SYNRA|nr:hypothetical protein BCR43DRAFT_494564 [Syncephalastrum racemosum]